MGRQGGDRAAGELSVDESSLNGAVPGPGSISTGPGRRSDRRGAGDGTDGSAALTLPSRRPQAPEGGARRSRSARTRSLICVSDTGDAATAEFRGQLGGAGRANVSDSAAPHGSHQRSAQRAPVPAWTAPADAARPPTTASGVREVKLALRRHVRGKGCQWWSGRREQFVGRNCHKKFFFAIGNDAELVVPAAAAARPGPLRPRREGVRRARGNRDETLRRGENRSRVRRGRARRREPRQGARAGSARVTDDGGRQERT